MEKKGIENLIAVAVAGARLGSIADDIFEDRKVNFADLPHAMSAFSALRDLADVDFGQVVPEAKDLDQIEKEQLVTEFDKVFDLANDGLEQKVEAGLKLAIEAASALQFLLDLGKRAKK